MDKKAVPRQQSHAGNRAEETHKRNDLLMEKARSVIDAVLALNQLGSDDESSRPSSPTTTGHAAENRKDDTMHDEDKADQKPPASTVEPTSKELQADADSTKKLYWLTEESSPEDFNGMTFPQKMHHVLRNDKHAEIIAWLPSGRSFVVRDQKKFASDIIPKYFGKHIAYTSFTRRLARWGWQNIAKGTYFNKDFNRDHPEQCLLMNYNSAVSNKPADAITMTSTGKPKGRTATDMLGFPGMGGNDMGYGIPGMNSMMPSAKKQCVGMGNHMLGNAALSMAGDSQGMPMHPGMPMHGSMPMQGQTGMFHPSINNNDMFSSFGTMGGVGNSAAMPGHTQGQMSNNSMMQNSSMMMGTHNVLQGNTGSQGNSSAGMNSNSMQSTQPSNNMMMGNQQSLQNMMDMTKLSDTRAQMAQKRLEYEQLQQRMLFEQQMQMQQTFFNQQGQGSGNMMSQNQGSLGGGNLMNNPGSAGGNHTSPPPGTPGRGQQDNVFFRNAAA